MRFVGMMQPAGGQAAVTGKVTARRFAPASSATATVVGSLVAILAAAYPLLAGLVHQLTIPNVGPTVATILIYAAVGVVVARHQPRNPLGWLLLVFILLVTVGIDAGYYACSPTASATAGCRSLRSLSC